MLVKFNVVRAFSQLFNANTGIYFGQHAEVCKPVHSVLKQRIATFLGILEASQVYPSSCTPRVFPDRALGRVGWALGRSFHHQSAAKRSFVLFVSLAPGLHGHVVSALRAQVSTELRLPLS